MLGAYRLGEAIGAGGGGVVYRATRADGRFEIDVAIKVLDSDSASADRARRESQMLAQLSHFAIPKILDAGVLPAGHAWFAMELVSGRPIDDFFLSDGSSLEQRISILRLLCEGVAIAHDAGVVHRDIKPSNILVDARGKPKLIDFGIATEVFAKVEDSIHRMLTPAWASPEQLRGETVTPASDIYQLGLLVARFVLQAAPAASGYAAHARARNVTALVARATAELPSERYRSARDLGDDLGRILLNVPTHARSWSLIDRTGFALLRNRRPLLLVMALGVVAAGVVVWDRASDRIVEQRASTALSFISELVEQADPTRQDGTRASAVAVLDRAAALLAREGSLPARERLRLATRMVDLYSELEEPALGASLAESVRVSTKSTDSSDVFLLLELHVAEANALLEGGDAQESSRRLDLADSLAATLSGAERTGARGVLAIARAAVATAEHRYTEAIELLNRVLRDAEASASVSREHLLVANNLMGVVLAYSDPATALDHHLRARQLAVEVHGPGHHAVIVNDIGAALAASELRDFQRALTLTSSAREAANRYMTRKSASHKLLAASYQTEAQVYTKMGDAAKANEAINRAIEHLASYDADSPALSAALLLRGRAAVVAKDRESALSDFHRAAKVAWTAGSRASPYDRISALNEAARIELALERVAEASATATELEHALDSLSSPDSVWASSVLLTLAHVQVARRDSIRAREFLDRLRPHLDTLAADNPRRIFYETRERELRAAAAALERESAAAQP